MQLTDSQTTVLLLLVHFVFDFILQTRWMAENKSKSIDALTRHACMYVSGLCLFSLFLPGLWSLWWALANGGLHWVTDFITSRISGNYFVNHGGVKSKGFWVTIGADQFIHAATLILTLEGMKPQ